MPGDLFHVHLGQTGVESAIPCWEQLAAQHGVSSADGTLVHGTPTATGDVDAAADDGLHRGKVFAESGNGRWAPRALLIDTDSWARSAVKRSSCGGLFGKASVVCGNDGDCGNFAAGVYTRGHDLWKKAAEDGVRRGLEACDLPEAVVTYHSVCGGTGSGMSVLLLEALKDYAPKALRVNVATLPSPGLPTTNLECLNAILALEALVNSADLVVCVQTEAVYNYCQAHAVLHQGQSINHAMINGVTAAAVNTLHHCQRSPAAPLARSLHDLRAWAAENSGSQQDGGHFLAPAIRWGAAPDLASLAQLATRAESRLVLGGANPAASKTHRLSFAFSGAVDTKGALGAMSASATADPRLKSCVFGAAAVSGGKAPVVAGAAFASSILPPPPVPEVPPALPPPPPTSFFRAVVNKVEEIVDVDLDGDGHIGGKRRGPTSSAPHPAPAGPSEMAVATLAHTTDLAEVFRGLHAATVGTHRSRGAPFSHTYIEHGMEEGEFPAALEVTQSLFQGMHANGVEDTE